MKQSRTSRVLNAIRLKKAPKGEWERSLPVEILEDIFALAMKDYSSGPARIAYRRSTLQPFLRSLACVCQVWYSMVTPMLYQEIYISSSDALAALARAVTKYPHLQPLVHSFQYSSTIFKSATVEHSQADAWNLKRIYRACTNLSSLAVRRPLNDFPTTDALILNSFGLELASIEKLTRLEIELPDGMPCEAELLFSPAITLPALQELVLDVLPIEEQPDKNLPASLPEHWMGWPRMPQLTRLCIVNWHVKHRCFCFPLHSRGLRIIELLGGNYASTTGFFHLYLAQQAETLESLTITAVNVADGDLYGHLTFFTSLTELCIPLKVFGRWVSYRFPESLEQLVLAGSPEKGFNEWDSTVLREFERKLACLLELKLASGSLGKLKVVRVVVRSIWMWSLGPVITFERAIKAADAAGVEITFGFLRGEENTFKDNLKEKLFEKFPRLERKLQ